MPQPAENLNDAANAIDGQHLQQSNEASDMSGKSNDARRDEKETKPAFSERCKTLWTKTGITWPRFKLMFKGALAPTIAVALFQADDFASHFSTVGYLVGITSILSLVIQPRSKFLQTMLVNVVFVCFAAACVTLALYCCVQARIHSGESGKPSHGGANTSGLAATGAQTAPYNSSAAAVAGIWLMVMIYCMSTVRAAKPQFMIPAMAGAIIGNVGMVYAPQFSSMVQAEAFVKRLLEAFLTGFGIGTGVSLFIFPLTSRTVVFNDMSAYLTSLRSALTANMDYVHSLENTDMFTFGRTDTMRHRMIHSPEAEVVKAKMQALQDASAKLNTDLPFAKREIALGNLGPDDLQSIAKLLRLIMLPMVGFELHIGHFRAYC
jgi:acid phosphatase family membrane protein YuiD